MTVTTQQKARYQAPSVSRYESGGVVIPQYSRGAILAIWLAAALPMGVLSWVVAPRLADSMTGTHPLVQALLLCLTAGLIWQFVLVVGLVGVEQRSLRWTTVRDALWLRAPKSPRSGRVGGKVWWIVVPLLLASAAEEVVQLTPPVARDFSVFLSSHAGHTFFQGAWGWFGVVLALGIFNTVLGEELLFRGFLLPRMNGAFGRFDWVVNGVLFGLYHVHVPWAMPGALLDTFVLAYPSKRYESTWIGIVVHSGQTVFFTLAVLALVI